MSNRKIGIFGGTFDPIHTGHLLLAETAYEKFQLERVLFMPTPEPYHRTDKKVSPLKWRIEMVKRAICGNDHFEFSDFEINLPGPTYTVNTVEALKRENPDWEIYLIAGGDSLFSMDKWYRCEDLFRMAVILTSPRKGEEQGASGSLKGDITGNSADTFEERTAFLKEKYGADIRNIEMPLLEISSSDIVKRLRAGKSVRYLLPDSVIDCIHESGLYRTYENAEIS